MFAIKNERGDYYVDTQTWSESIANARQYTTVLQAAWALADAEFESIPVSIVCAYCGESPCVPVIS